MIDALVQQWVRQVSRQGRSDANPNTFRQYGAIIRSFMAYRESQQFPMSASVKQREQYINDWADRPLRNGNPPAPATRTLRRTVVRAFYRFYDAYQASHAPKDASTSR